MSEEPVIFPLSYFLVYPESTWTPTENYQILVNDIEINLKYQHTDSLGEHWYLLISAS